MNNENSKASRSKTTNNILDFFSQEVKLFVLIRKLCILHV